MATLAARRRPRRAQAAAGEAQHPRHLGRRHRLVEHQRLQSRHDGLPHAQHRPHRPRRRALHRLLRPAIAAPPGAPPSSPASRRSAPACSRSACPARRRGCRTRTRPSPTCSRRRATPPASSARTISATATSSCRPCTASTSSSATSTTSTPRRSRRTSDYPKDPTFKAKFGPRGVLKCVATATDTPGDDPRFGKWGKQRCEDTGPLTAKRMETVDEEFLAATLDFIDRANRDQQAVLRVVQLHPHAHLDPPQAGVRGQDRARRLSPTAWSSMTARSASS